LPCRGQVRINQPSGKCFFPKRRLFHSHADFRRHFLLFNFHAYSCDVKPSISASWRLRRRSDSFSFINLKQDRRRSHCGAFSFPIQALLSAASALDNNLARIAFFCVKSENPTPLCQANRAKSKLVIIVCRTKMSMNPKMSGNKYMATRLIEAALHRAAAN